MKEKLEVIQIEKIHPHPDNPRKNLGDLTELTESIKKYGIMQDLVVIPKEDEPGEYTVVIGHRRRAAAVEAGLTELKCKIVKDMSKKEQVGIMLVENIQRNDLTVYEQAQGFQMMFDLGTTAEEIAEKTGFSTSTVYHRLNIAKLNQKYVERQEQNDDFQLSIKDLIELEKVKKVSERNKLLKLATDSRDLRYRINRAVMEEKAATNLIKAKKILAKKGIEEYSGAFNSWDGKWDIVKRIHLREDLGDDIKIKKVKDKLYYKKDEWNDTLYIFRKFVEKPEKEKKKTPEQIKRETEEAQKKKLEKIYKRMLRDRRQFVQDILYHRVEPLEDTLEFRDTLWKIMIDSEREYSLRFDIGESIMMKEWHRAEKEEKEEARKKQKELNMSEQFLALLGAKANSPIDWRGEYNEENANKEKKLYEILRLYGMTLTEEEQQVLDGTHELYKK